MKYISKLKSIFNKPTKPTLEELKTQGDEFYKAKKWKEAISSYKHILKNEYKEIPVEIYERYSRAYLNYRRDMILLDDNLLKSEIKTLCSDKKLEIALISTIRKEVATIRNDKKDKQLALKLINNINKLFNNNFILQNELAISYMHIHDWNNAKKLFELLLYRDNNLFTAFDYGRLAKCYEMMNIFDNYKGLILEAIKKYPTDLNLHFRYIYATFIDDFKEKNFRSALTKINLLLGTEKPNFWSIDKKQILRYRNICIKNIDIKSIKSSKGEISIVSNRADGLGERLNAMLNAVVIAKTFGYSFGYTWKNELHANHFQKDAEKNKTLIGHAVVSEGDFFDESFIDKYSLNNKTMKNFRTISGKNSGYNSLYKLEIEKKLNGWFSPRLELREHFNAELLIDSVFSYGDAFDFLEFNREITDSINLAKNIMLSDKYVALHLRSGDVFYGEYRKFVHYTYKGIVLPLAKAIIKKYLNENIKVIVFGQDKAVLEYLKSEYSIITVDDFDEYKKFDNTQKAMFEITLMSKAETIIAGSSGFAKLASWIGDKELKLPSNYYSAKEQTTIIKNDLKKHENSYPKLQSSFAYWYAYYYGRHSKKISEVEYLLNKAYEFDSENELYPLILASLQYKFNLEKKGELTLSKLFSKDKIYDVDLHSASQVINAKTMGKLNILEFIPEFKKASSEGNPFASVIMYTLNRDSSIYLNQISTHIDKNDWLKEFYLFQKNKL